MGFLVEREGLCWVHTKLRGARARGRPFVGAQPPGGVEPCLEASPWADVDAGVMTECWCLPQIHVLKSQLM